MVGQLPHTFFRFKEIELRDPNCKLVKLAKPGDCICRYPKCKRPVTYKYVFERKGLAWSTKPICHVQWLCDFHVPFIRATYRPKEESSGPLPVL